MSFVLLTSIDSWTNGFAKARKKNEKNNKNKKMMNKKLSAYIAIMVANRMTIAPTKNQWKKTANNTRITHLLKEK